LRLYGVSSPNSRQGVEIRESGLSLSRHKFDELGGGTGTEMGRLSFLRPCFLGLLTIPNKCCMPCVLIREEEKVMRRTVSTFYKIVVLITINIDCEVRWYCQG
jgi:hypothetical protein